MAEFTHWIEGLRIALAVRDSLWLTASLSAMHLFGVTLVGGGALISGLRAAGLLFGDQPATTVLTPAARAIGLGVLIAVTTGVFLVLPRAHSAVANGFFRWKMMSLAIAVIVQVFVYRRTAGSGGQVPPIVSLFGTAACLSVIVAGCAFILLE